MYYGTGGPVYSAMGYSRQSRFGVWGYWTDLPLDNYEVGIQSKFTAFEEPPPSDDRYVETDLHHYSQLARKAAGWTLAASMPFQQAFERASLYPGTPARWLTTLVKYEKTLMGSKIIHQPLFEMNAIKAGKWAAGLKIVSKSIGVAGVLLAGRDMAINGVTTSNALDLVMSGMAVTGFGTTVAATYFILNATSILFTGKDIGQQIDAASMSLTGKSITQYINE
jgi:hypothetical protein